MSENADRSKRDPRDAYLRATYGITAKDYDLLLEQQDHDCAICRRDEHEVDGLVVDHRHRRGERCVATDVRGLLCNECNLGLGHFKDDVWLMATAVDYLKFFEKKGFPWNGYDACFICGNWSAPLRGHRHPEHGEWMGDLCHNCLTAMRKFRHDENNLRWAIGYLYFYDRTARGAYWRAEGYKPFPHGVPEPLLWGAWEDADRCRPK